MNLDSEINSNIAMVKTIDHLNLLGCTSGFVLFPIYDASSEVMLDRIRENLDAFTSRYNLGMEDYSSLKVGRLFFGNTAIANTLKELPVNYDQVETGMQLIISNKFGTLSAFGLFMLQIAAVAMLSAALGAPMDGASLVVGRSYALRERVSTGAPIWRVKLVDIVGRQGVGTPRRRGAGAFTRVTVSSLQHAPTAAMAATHDHAVHHEQDDRADNGRDPRRDIEEVIERMGVEKRRSKESADEGAGHADQHSHDDPAGIFSREHGLGDDSRQQAEDEECDDAHAGLHVWRAPMGAARCAGLCGGCSPPTR